MVKEADQFRAADEQQRERIGAKNGLESFAFNMKSTVEDEQMKGKLSDEERKTILDKCEEIIHWLDANQLAEKDEFEHKLKEAEKVCNPIITKMYQVMMNLWLIFSVFIYRFFRLPVALPVVFRPVLLVSPVVRCPTADRPKVPRSKKSTEREGCRAYICTSRRISFFRFSVL